MPASPVPGTHHTHLGKYFKISTASARNLSNTKRKTVPHRGRCWGSKPASSLTLLSTRYAFCQDGFSLGLQHGTYEFTCSGEVGLPPEDFILVQRLTFVLTYHWPKLAWACPPVNQSGSRESQLIMIDWKPMSRRGALESIPSVHYKALSKWLFHEEINGVMNGWIYKYNGICAPFEGFPPLWGRLWGCCFQFEFHIIRLMWVYPELISLESY